MDCRVADPVLEMRSNPGFKIWTDLVFIKVYIPLNLNFSSSIYFIVSQTILLVAESTSAYI